MCFWCLEPGEKCKNFILGNGSFCKASGIQKSSFKDYISNLWTSIGWDEKNMMKTTRLANQHQIALETIIISKLTREKIGSRKNMMRKTIVAHPQSNQQPLYLQTIKTTRSTCPIQRHQRHQTTPTMIQSPLSQDASLILWHLRNSRVNRDINCKRQGRSRIESKKLLQSKNCKLKKKAVRTLQSMPNPLTLMTWQMPILRISSP